MPDQRFLVVDFETRSFCDLRACGVYRYVEDPTTEPLVLAWWFRDGEGVIRKGTLAPGEKPDAALLDALADPGVPVWAHNANFDRLIWNGPARRTWPELPELPLERWHCSMSVCLQNALPGKLEDVAKALRMPEGKDKRGTALIQKLSRPRRHPVRKDLYFLPPMLGDMEALREYALRDVELTAELIGRFGDLPPDERRVWLFDQRVNDAGIPVDTELAEVCVRAGDAQRLRAFERCLELTGAAPTQVEALREWTAGKLGRPVPDLTKNSVTALLARDDLPPEVREALECRRMASVGSAAKFTVALRAVCADGRLRGLLQYHGASTGRWAGRLIQPQNLPRPSLKIDPAALKATDGEPDVIELAYGPLTEVLRSAVRAMFVAEPGHVLVRADYSGVESRVLAVLAGEKWKVEAFRAFDRGEGDDNYCAFASKLYGHRVTKKEHPEKRQVGKVAELACGYQGAVGAMRAMGGEAMGLTEAQMQDLVRAWREAHPAVVEFWRRMEGCAVNAVASPGRVFHHRGIAWKREGERLLCRLPSGRKLTYWYPSIVEGVYGPAVAYWAVKQLDTGGRRWCEIQGYGGLFTENIVQAVCRDLLVHAMLGAERAGYTVVLHVHDEIVCHEPEDSSRADPEALCRIMCDLPDWASGWPIAAEGEAGRFYWK